jgi:predicted permease
VALSLSTGLLSCGVQEYPALIAMFGSPVAVSSAVMAGSMGSDEQLATQLVVWTSIFSIFTIFAEVCILMMMGLLAV